MENPEATLSSSDERISFTVERPTDAVFRRGRESVRGRLSWAGFSLGFALTNP